MKNNIKKIIILSFFLILFSFVIMMIMGRTYKVVFNNCDSSSYNLAMEEETGKLEILDEEFQNGNCIVKVKGIKPGIVHLYMDYGGFQTCNRLYIHKNMVITDNSFIGKSTGSEVIPISFSIIVLYVLFLLIKRYKQCLNENIYQYKNIAYLGIIIFLSFFLVSNVLSIFNYNGLFETVNRIISLVTFVSYFMLPISFITFVIVTISNINLIIKEGKSLRNLLGLFLGIFICLMTLLPNYVYNFLMQTQSIDIYNLNTIYPYVYNFIETLIYLLVSYLECILIATIIIAIKVVRKKITMDKDYMIILGCQINGDGSLTPLLKGRVDRAIEFRNEQLKVTGKDLIFVPSGGKGRDEVISEAEAMKRYLLEQGIKEKNILVENKSKNTYENIKFSNELIGDKKAKIAFSTTNYHVMRSGLIGTNLGLKLEGVGSKTKAYFWINSFIREFIGTLYEEKKKHILFFGLILIIILLMIVITYIGYNV